MVDFYWVEEGLVFPNHAQEGRPLNIPWSGIRFIEAVDPWPKLTIEWHDALGPSWRTFGPISYGPERFEERVIGLIEEARRRLEPNQVDAGWIGAPVVTWETVDAMPSGESEPDGGAYRAGTKHERLLARRRPGSDLEGLYLRFIVGRPPASWRHQPRTVALTRSWVYVEAADRQVRRIRRDALRAVRTNDWGDAVYVFGRKTSLVLLRRDHCPVMEALDVQLVAGENDVHRP